MKKFFENWRGYVREQTGDADLKVIHSLEDIISYIKENPNQKIYLDSPKGTTKKFGGLEKKVLPFDYGEWPDLINPADDMVWDLVLVPGSKASDDNLVPIGYVHYNGDPKIWRDEADKEPPKGIQNNDKIILAQDGKFDADGKSLINNFFNDLWQIKEVVWFEDHQRET